MPNKKDHVQQLTNVNRVEQIEANLRSLKATLEERVAERTAIVQLLQDIAVAANESLTVNAAMQFALDRVCAHTGWPVGHVYLVSEVTSGELISTDIWHVDNPYRLETFLKITAETRFARGVGLPGRVLASGEPIWVVDMSEEPDFRQAKLAQDIGIKAGFAFPVLVGKEVVAILEFFSGEVAEPDQPLLEIMAHIGTQLGRVAERKRAEAQIRESEQQLAEAQQIAHIGSWQWDITTNTVSWSDELCRIYGLKPQEGHLTYEKFLDLIHPNDREHIHSYIRTAYKSRQPFSFDHRILRPDGTIRILHGRGKVVVDEQGQLLKMIGTEQDITERKEAEESLQKSQALFKALFKSAPDAAILVNGEGRIERVNKQMEKMFGYSREELLGKPVEILMPARFRGRHINHRALYYAEPRTRAMGAGLALYGKRKDGSEFPIDIMLSPLQTEDEVSVISVIHDITERKQREEEIKRARDFSDRLINSSLDGIFAFDRKIRYTLWNPGMERISGVSKAEVLGRSAFEVFPFLKETGEDKFFHEALAGNATIARDRYYHVAETGREGFFEGYYSPIRNESSEVVGGLAIIRDITERKQMEAELTEVQHQLMEVREAERLHLAQDLHDGPVQNLHGISYRLGELEDALIDEVSLGRLVAAQVALQKVIQMLRAICGELRPPTLAPFGLEKAIRSHAEQFQVEQPEIEVRLDLMPDGQRLAERVRLALFRIYREALNNVVRHAEASYVSIRLTLNASQVILEIQDDGRGFKMPKRQIQLARAGHLGIVGAIERAEAIGGYLRVVSAPGEGTVIRAIIPCQNETKQLNSLS
jgi:PAS domain S-box-containing protein